MGHARLMPCSTSQATAISVERDIHSGSGFWDLSSSFPAVLCLLAVTAAGKKIPFLCARHPVDNPACREEEAAIQSNEKTEEKPGRIWGTWKEQVASFNHKDNRWGGSENEGNREEVERNVEAHSGITTATCTPQVLCEKQCMIQWFFWFVIQRPLGNSKIFINSWGPDHHNWAGRLYENRCKYRYRYFLTRSPWTKNDSIQVSYTVFP